MEMLYLIMIIVGGIALFIIIAGSILIYSTHKKIRETFKRKIPEGWAITKVDFGSDLPIWDNVQKVYVEVIRKNLDLKTEFTNGFALIDTMTFKTNFPLCLNGWSDFNPKVNNISKQTYKQYVEERLEVEKLLTN